MRVFVWTAATNWDYTGGDIVVIADDVAHARRIAKGEVMCSPHGNSGDIGCGFDGSTSVDGEPDYECALISAMLDGFIWHGPGGG